MLFSESIMSGMHLASLVLWSIIIIWALPSYRRCILGRAGTDDWKQTAFGAIGLATIIYKLRIIADIVPIRTDYWGGVALLLSNLAAVLVIVFVHLERTPEGHKRALLISHLGIVSLCMVGGFLG